MYMNKSNFIGLQYNSEMAPSWLKHYFIWVHEETSYLLQLPAPDYEGEIWLEQVYFREVLDHLRSLFP